MTVRRLQFAVDGPDKVEILGSQLTADSSQLSASEEPEGLLAEKPNMKRNAGPEITLNEIVPDRFRVKSRPKPIDEMNVCAFFPVILLTVF